MPQFLFDTDRLTLFEHGHGPLRSRLAGLRSDAVAVSAVTAEEALRGRLARLNRARDGHTRIHSYAQLVATVMVLNRFPLLPFDQASEDQFQLLLALRTRVGSQDLKIAAVALSNNLILITRNRGDFGRIPGLVIDDWSR
jgi:tRNA(fMet)-specific endonuclease VapC